jgi:DNA-binding NarL/FixJ family response regulator
VWGILPLEASAEELLAAVRALHEGLLVGSPALVEPLITRLSGREHEELEPLPEPLTGRETEVLQLLAQGLGNKGIAAALSISEHTVKFHVSAIYAKLGAASRTEAVRMGVRQGLIVL